MLQRILLPVDERELDRLPARAQRLDATELLLLRVVPEGAARSLLRRAQDELAARAHALHELGFKVGFEVLAGDPGRRIVQFAVDCRATLIAMLTRGQTGPPAWMRGSVAERVLRESPLPVLLDLPPAADGARAALHRILVPVDPRQREPTVRVAELVASLARRRDVVVELLAVVDERRGEAGVVPRTEAEQCLDAVHTKLGGVAALRRVIAGVPDREITKAAADQDLLAIAVQRDPGRNAFGSTAEAVLRRCPCAVLAVPPAERAPAGGA